MQRRVRWRCIEFRDEDGITVSDASGQVGIVSALFLKPLRHEPLEEVRHAMARVGHGIVGDCHAQPLGPRQVLVVRTESLDGLDIAPWQVRANIATRGLPESALRSGSVLAVRSNLRIRITHECEICAVLRRYVPAETLKDLSGRRGSLGVILHSGEISVGDFIRVITDRYPEVPERVYERVAWVIERIPRGYVTTYDRLLALVGATKPFFRVLPTYLRRAGTMGLPAHRVLTSAGKLTGHLPAQRGRLHAEGVAIDEAGRVDVELFGWDARSLYRVQT